MAERSTGDGSAAASWESGVAAFLCGDLTAAHAAFERAHRRDSRDPRFMSWYGMTLVLVEKNSSLGVLLCDRALRGASDADLFLNQARVHFALHQRERTVRALQRGLELWPDHAGLQQARDALGWRRRPVLPFLSRNAPLNRLLGRLRHRFGAGGGDEGGPTPATLGVILPLVNLVSGQVPGPVAEPGAQPAAPPDPPREP